MQTKTVLNNRCFPALITALVICLTSFIPASFADEKVKPKDELRHWRQYPLPHGTPKTKRPADSEFLKVLPPLRKAPQFSAEQKKLGLAVWWGDYSLIMDSLQPPTAEELARTPVIRTPAGEDEPLVLGLWGISKTELVTLSVKVKKSPFPITIRNVVFAPRMVPAPHCGDSVKGGRVVGFATYLPLQATAEVSAGHNTVFWLTVEVPKDAKPGKYEIELSLVVHGKKVLPLPVTVEVLDYKLPRADIAYGMYFRPYGQCLPKRYRKPEMMKAYWRDLARHGMTSATLYSYQRIHDKTGKLALNNVKVLRQLDDMIAAGLVTPDVPVMYLSGGSIDQSDPVMLQQVLASFKAEAKKRNWPELLWYGPDEPKVNDKVLAQFKGLQPIRKHMRIITAISGHAAGYYSKFLDVWVVNAGLVNPELSKLAAENDVALWTYTCHNRGRGNAAFERFYAGLYTWALNLKGNFEWAYTENYSWEADRNAVYCRVLPSDAGPVPSVAWEARREGVEDYRTLRLLEQRIAANPTKPAAKQAQAWLDKLRKQVDWDITRNMPPSMYPWDGPEMYPLCPNFEPSEFSKIRTKATEFIVQLK